MTSRDKTEILFALILGLGGGFVIGSFGSAYGISIPVILISAALFGFFAVPPMAKTLAGNNEED